MSSLQNKKLQIEVTPDTDKVLYKLIEKLEKQSSKKGFVNREIKKRLELYQVLSEVVGEEDPLQLVKKLLINVNTHGIQGDTKPLDEDTNNALDLINGLDNWK